MDFSSLAPFWILFSLLSAFFHASRLVVTKRLSISFSAQALTLYVNLASLVVTLPLIYWYHDFPLHDSRYLTMVLAGAIISGLGGWSLNYAIEHGDISLVGPVITLTPGFVILIEWMTTRDLPGGTGFLGIALLTAGGYVLSIDRTMAHWYTPLVRLLRAPGSLFTLIAAFCFAVTTTFGRVAIQLSDPLSVAVIVAIVNPIVLFVMFSMQDRRFYRQVINHNLRREVKPLLVLGLLFALMRIADQIALSMTLASYAMSIKRTAGIFSVLLGKLLYHEHHIPERLLGSAIMLIGLLVLMQS